MIFFLNLANKCLTLDTFPTAQGMQYICLYMLKNRSTAKKMPQPGKALLSIGKPARQAAPREELMLSEGRIACYCEGSQFNAQVKTIYHGKIPTKFCSLPSLSSCNVNKGPQKPDTSVHSCTAVSFSSYSSLSGKAATANAMSGSPRYLQRGWVLGNFVTFNRQFSCKNSLCF